jgi:hypothetical protein
MRHPDDMKEKRKLNRNVICHDIATAKKYEMVVASECLNQQFAKSKFMKNDPVMAFCAAYS